jgi:hypothetical protein
MAFYTIDRKLPLGISFARVPTTLAKVKITLEKVKKSDIHNS